VNAYKGKFKIISLWIASSIFDASILVLWALMQWLVARALEHFSLSVIDAWVLVTFRLIFAFTTLATILIYVVLDIRKLIIRSRKRIERETTD
jgi:hypothetical protein